MTYYTVCKTAKLAYWLGKFELEYFLPLLEILKSFILVLLIKRSFETLFLILCSQQVQKALKQRWKRYFSLCHHQEYCGILRTAAGFSFWPMSEITSQLSSNLHVIWQLLKPNEKLFFSSGHWAQVEVVKFNKVEWSEGGNFLLLFPVVHLFVACTFSRKCQFTCKTWDEL